MKRSAALALLLAAGTLAGPAGRKLEHRCAAYCLSDDDSKFAYTPGQTYVYAYSSDVETTLAGDSDEASRLHVTATAEIDANSACDFTLWLRDVTLSDSDPKNADLRRQVDGMASFKEELERYPLSFSYQDGRVEELCSSQLEPVWALNFKRGLLSATVNNLESLSQAETQKYETDVSGYCSTDYSVRQTVDGTVVTKTKDLLTCRERGHLVSSLQTTPYHSASKIQSMPLLKSTQECRQTVSAGRLREVVCTEDHTFRPFSRGQSGAVTRTTLRLTELAVRPADRLPGHDTLTARSSAMFDHADGALLQRDRLDSAQGLLDELLQKTADDVRPEVPHLFARLVETLRYAGEAALAQLMAGRPAGAAHRYLVDALPMVGTAAAMAVMRDMMLSGQTTAEQADRWMTSLAFVHEPRLDMVEAVAPLLAAADARTQTLLGISSLVHRYCRSRADCGRKPAVRRAVVGIERLLGAGCGAESNEQRTRVLAALKALGNLGLLVHGEKSLRACFGDRVGVETRLAAVRAYRRMSCEVIGASGLMNTFANRREDSEVRIAAYLSVMECPSHEIVDKLLEILSAETVNQVGSFVWSHITNIQETSDPSKHYLKSLLYNAELSKKFSLDARKFSRYFEKTTFFESMNAGGSMEGTVVFSPESYIPRSGMLNLTVDLFGEAINLLEVGGRVEGLEKYVENLFGHDGLYPQASINQILKMLHSRQSSNDISKLSDAYKAAHSKANSFSASAYMKIFGNELGFGSFNDLGELAHALDADGPLKLLQRLARERDWTKNYQFLDSSYTIPTIAGLPFTLKAMGTAAVTLKTSGGFNIQSWNRMQIEGFVKPSAAMEVAGEMGVDARVARTGLKLSTNLHTSTVLDGRVEIESSKIISLKINMPKDKVEILDVKTRLHSVYQNRDRQLDVADNAYRYDACSDSYTSVILGVKFCTEITYPLPTREAPSFPLSGPFTARLTVEKTDTVEAFKFEYRHSNEAGIRKSSVMVDTPGTATNRRIYADYMVNFRRQGFRASLITPVKSLGLSGSLDLDGDRRHLDVALEVDGGEVFGMSSSLARIDSPSTVQFEPSLEIRGGSGPVLKLHGGLSLDRNGKKYSADLVITELYDNPVIFHGAANEKNGTYAILSSLKSYALTGTLTGSFHHVHDNLMIQTKTEYSLLNGPAQTISLNMNVGHEKIGLQNVYKAFLDTKMSALPRLDAQLTANLAYGPGQHEVRVLLVRGQHRYQLGAALGNSGGRVFGEVTVQAVHLGLDFKLAAKLDMSNSHKLEVGGIIQVNRERFAKLNLIVNFLSEEYNYDYGINTNITLMTSSYQFVTGIRRLEKSSEFTFLASRAALGESKEISLAATLGEEAESGSSTFDLMLRLPDYPSTHLSGRLSAGVGGRYLASAQLRRGPSSYLLSGEYRYSAEHVLELRAALPQGDYSCVLSARTAGGTYRVKADMRLGRRVTTVFRLRPGDGETHVDFELFWNKDVDDSQSVVLNIEMKGVQIVASLRYPGRLIRLRAGLTPNGVRAAIEYEPGKHIIVEGEVSVQSENSLASRLAIQTPFPGYTSMVLTFRTKPDLVDESSLLNFQVTGRIEEREVALSGKVTASFDWMTRPRAETANHLRAEFNLTTPVAGWERCHLACTYLQRSNVLSARVAASKNDDEIAVGMFFEKFSLPEVFRVVTKANFVLPVDRAKTGELGVDLALRDSRLDAVTVVQWTSDKVNDLSMGVHCKYNMTSKVWADIAFTLKTPFEGMEQLDAHAEVNKDEKSTTAAFTVNRDASEMLLHTYLNAFYDSLDSFGGDLHFGCSVCPGFGAGVEYRSDQWNSLFNITATWKDQEAILTGSSTSGAAGRKQDSLTLQLPNPVRQYHLKHAYDVDWDTEEGTLWDFWEISRDSQTVTVDMTSFWSLDAASENNATFTLSCLGRVTSPFEGWESAAISQQTTFKKGGDLGMTVISNTELEKGDRRVVINDSGIFRSWTDWRLSRNMTSNTAWFRRATFLLSSATELGVIRVAWQADWDGQTAELTFAGASAVDGGDGLDVTLAAQWFGGVARRVSFVMPLRSASWAPRLEIAYAPDKSIRIYGVVHKIAPAFESHLTLETPFTDTVLLKLSHDVAARKKHADVKLLHGGRTYHLRIELEANFPGGASLSARFMSPSWFLGSNAFIVNYELTDKLVLNGEVSHDTWKVALAAEMKTSGGRVQVLTPFGGFRSLSFEYTVAQKEVTVRLSYGAGSVVAAFTDSSDYDMLEYNIVITTPYRDFQRLTITLSKPRNQNLFALQCVHNNRNTMSFSGEYELSGPRSSFVVQIRTSFDVLPTAEMRFSYSLIEPAASLMFSKGSDKVQIEATGSLSLASSQVSIDYRNSLIFGPRRVTATGTYDVKEPEKRLDVLLAKDADAFSLQGRARMSASSSYATLRASTPVPGFEAITVVSKVDSGLEGSALIFELTKNHETIKALFEVGAKSESKTALFEIQTPFEQNRHMRLSAKYDLLSEPSRVVLVAERDSTKKTVIGTMTMTDNTVHFTLITPFPGWETVSVEGRIESAGNKRSVWLVLSRNEEQVEVVAHGELDWAKSGLTLAVNTPFVTARAVGLNVGYDIRDRTKTLSAALTKNEQRMEVICSGAAQKSGASGFIIINMPFSSWKNVRYSAMYDFSQAEKKMEASYELNGHKKVLSINGFFGAVSAYLNAVTPFKGYEAIRVNSTYVNTREKREVGYEVHVNEERHRLYVLYEREGTDKIKLRANTPIHGMHVIEVNSRRQSFPDGMGFYFDSDFDGKRTSGEARTSVGKTTMGIDIGIKSHMEGYENVRMSGSVNYSKRKKSFRIASESKKQKIELSGFFIFKPKGGVGKLVSKLPFPGFEKVNAKLKYKTGKTNKFILNYSKGKKKVKINGDVILSANGFVLNLKTPFNGFKTLTANAGRVTASDGTVSAELLLKREDRQISVKYRYMFSLKSGDGHIEISTPYEGFEDMMMSLTYQNQAKFRKMAFTARRNSREWLIEHSRSWGAGTEDTVFTLTSPIESIRSIKISRSFNVRNLAAMEYRASYERNDRKFTISGTGSIQDMGKQVSLDVTVQTPLDIGQLSANVAYNFASLPLTLNSNLSAGPRYIKLMASLGASSGTVKLKTTNPRLPTVDIDYTASVGGNTRDVSANVVLADGRTLSVTYQADYSRPKAGSGRVRVASTTFGDRELVWEHTQPDDDFTGSVHYHSPNAQLDWSLSVEGTMFIHRKILSGASITSEWLTTQTELDLSYDRRKGFDLTVDLTVDDKKYKLVMNRKRQRERHTLSVTYDGHMVKDVKIDGTWSTQPGLAGRRSFEFTYSRGRKRGSLGGFVQLGGTGKSGTVSLQLTTPFPEAANVKVESNWNFISPNRVIKVDFTRNRLNYMASLSGSGSPMKGDYRLEVSMPSVQVSRRKSIDDAVLTLSYDLSDGFHFKTHMEKPFESTAEIHFQRSNVLTTLKFLLHFMDKLDLLPSVDHRHFELDYQNSRRSGGRHIEATLETSAFNLGKIEVDADVQKTAGKSTIVVNYKRGSKTGQFLGELSQTEGSGGSVFSLKTPISGYEDVNLSGSYQVLPGRRYALNIDYSRGQKYFRLDSSSTVTVKKAKKGLKSVSAETNIKVSSKLTQPVELTVTANADIKDIGTAKQSVVGKFEGGLNGKKVGLTYTVDRDEHGRRVATVVLTTPLKKPYQKMVLNSDVSLHSNKAAASVQFGPQKLSLDVSWLKGEAGQYGAEVRLSTPYKVLRSLELEAKGTVNRDGTIDVLGLYRRNNKIVRVRGVVKPNAIDLNFETPTFGNFNVQGGVVVQPGQKTYSVRGLVTLQSGARAGGEFTLKFAALSDLQLTVDVQTPLSGWERFNVDVAYTNIEVSRVIRVALETPQMKRLEVSMELTNLGSGGTTNLRAGVTTNYLGNVFTFWTHIVRDEKGMKYELELESPFHVNIPLLPTEH